MAITLELYELKNICKDMAELGAANFYKKMAPGKDLISQREAYSEYGEARVKGWVKWNSFLNRGSDQHETRSYYTPGLN